MSISIGAPVIDWISSTIKWILSVFLRSTTNRLLTGIPIELQIVLRFSAFLPET